MIVASEPYSEAISSVISSLYATAIAVMPWCTFAFNMATMPPYINCLDLCSVSFAFENCNAFHTFKVPRFPVPRLERPQNNKLLLQHSVRKPGWLIPVVLIPNTEWSKLFKLSFTNRFNQSWSWVVSMHGSSLRATEQFNFGRCGRVHWSKIQKRNLKYQNFSYWVIASRPID